MILIWLLHAICCSLFHLCTFRIISSWASWGLSLSLICLYPKLSKQHAKQHSTVGQNINVSVCWTLDHKLTSFASNPYMNMWLSMMLSEAIGPCANAFTWNDLVRCFCRYICLVAEDYYDVSSDSEYLIRINIFATCVEIAARPCCALDSFIKLTFIDRWPSLS